jgi:hypothetical protein
MDVSSAPAGEGDPMTFMSDARVTALCPKTGPGEDASPQSWPLRPLLPGRETQTL